MTATPASPSPAGAETAMFDVVRRAWTDALPNTPFDPDTSWEASGADSMRSLHLVLNLERSLDRKVSFDLISRHMTARTLARVLTEPETAAPADAPTVFLVPGVFGDGPILADFRRSFGHDVRFVVVDLPDMETAFPVHADLPATGRRVADAIDQQAPDGPLQLAGFSFGGLVAFEAARHLVDLGRDVVLVGLLDSFANGGGLNLAEPRDAAEQAAGNRADPIGDADAGGGLLARVGPRRGEGVLAYAERVVFGASLKFDKIDLARRITLAGHRRLSQDQMIGRRKIVLGLGRMRAVDRWAPAPLDVPVFLACTADGEQRGSPAQWSALCPRLRVLRVPGGHFDLFSPPALAILTPAFHAAVIAASHERGHSLPSATAPESAVPDGRLG